MLAKDYIKDGKPILMSFQAGWCSSCQTMNPILKKVQDKLQDSIEYVEIDIDKNPQIAAAFQVRTVPSLLLFKEAQIVWRQAGLIQAADLLTQIQEQLE